MCDEFPELYFPDADGDFPWDKSGWGDESDNEYEMKIEDAKNDLVYHFATLEEAKVYALANPKTVIVRNPQGTGFIVKGTVPSERVVYRQKQEALKRADNENLGRPRNAGIAWSDKDLALLIRQHGQQVSIKDIAQQLGRTPVAISAKLFNLELITDQEHQANMVTYSSISN